MLTNLDYALNVLVEVESRFELIRDFDIVDPSEPVLAETMREKTAEGCKGCPFLVDCVASAMHFLGYDEKQVDTLFEASPFDACVDVGNPFNGLDIDGARRAIARMEQE